MSIRYLTVSTARAVLAAAAASLAVSPAAHASTDLYINGAGDGHGIGMSQYGAYGAAQHGWTYQHILGHYYQGTGLRTTDPNQTVRVLLGTGRYGDPGFTGAASAVAPWAGHRTVTLSTTQKYSVHAVSGGNVALYDSSGHQLASVRPPLVVSGPGPVNFLGHGQYRGTLEFRWTPGPHAQTVNGVDLEDYVRGVVSAEMPAYWSAAALEAQSVAARTYAITTSVNGNGYRLYSDTRSQMYTGVSAETSSTDAAEQATRGQVVTLDGQPVVTYFFASSGGHTESIQDAWSGSGPQSWLRGVDDPYDNAGGNPYYRWSRRISLTTAAADLGSLVRGSLRGITVTQTGTSPRVMKASVVGSGGTTTVSGSQLQGAFGLMSTWMSFSTISTNAGTTRTRLAHAGAHATMAGLPGAAWPALHGVISPAPPRGGTLDVQRRAGRRWETTVSGARVDTSGSYDVPLRAAGRYRVVYRGLDGPAVPVG
jgi:stage II sporulation protein D